MREGWKCSHLWFSLGSLLSLSLAYALRSTCFSYDFIDFCIFIRLALHITIIQSVTRAFFLSCWFSSFLVITLRSEILIKFLIDSMWSWLSSFWIGRSWVEEIRKINWVLNAKALLHHMGVVRVISIDFLSRTFKVYLISYIVFIDYPLNEEMCF